MSVNPGSTLFTVIPNGANSPASVFAQLATAPRVVFDTPSPGIGAFTLVEMMLMIRPNPADFIPGTNACTSSWLHTTCIRSARSNSSGSASRIGPPFGPPVLFTSTRTPATVPAAACTRSGSAKSATTYPCDCPSFGNSPTTRSSAASSRAISVTSAPSAAISTADARPSPCVDPHTNARLPRRDMSIAPAYHPDASSTTAIVTITRVESRRSSPR